MFIHLLSIYLNIYYVLRIMVSPSFIFLSLNNLSHAVLILAYASFLLVGMLWLLANKKLASILAG